MSSYFLSQIAFVGALFSGFLIIFAILLKFTNGLFWSRPLQRYKENRFDPHYEKERNIGKKFSRWTLKYLPPFFIGFLLILLWSTFS